MGVVIFAIDARLCHSFHEIELLDIPNILFPSQRGKLYQVIGIGMQEKFRNFYVIIKGQHGSITYRLPEELLTWVPHKLLLVKVGACLFPCPCEFSYFQGRCFAYSCQLCIMMNTAGHFVKSVSCGVLYKEERTVFLGS